ncbi:hypothetical protein K2F54_05115 [Cryobacterium sp. 1639]|nr:hypothetical protein [Cryobacterium sp. 1639]
MRGGHREGTGGDGGRDRAVPGQRDRGARRAGIVRAVESVATVGTVDTVESIQVGAAQAGLLIDNRRASSSAAAAVAAACAVSVSSSIVPTSISLRASALVQPVKSWINSAGERKPCLAARPCWPNSRRDRWVRVFASHTARVSIRPRRVASFFWPAMSSASVKAS